jgi:hypothetical protein
MALKKPILSERGWIDQFLFLKIFDIALETNLSMR